MIRYYPPSKVLTNQNTSGEEFTLNGEPYKGKYYATYDGKYYTGPNPQTGPNQLLKKQSGIISDLNINPVNVVDMSNRQEQKSAFPVIPGFKSPSNRVPGKPNSYYPQPQESDYRRGFIIRYFTKKENQKGFITEISQEEYNSIVNGTADYDISIYQTAKIFWKISGPLRSQRKSQYNIIAGIIETNQRLTEEINKNFLGIIEFIGGEYDKFARPTP